MTVLERSEYAPAFTALGFLEGDRADITPRAKAYIFANAAPIARDYRRMVTKHTTGEEMARIALNRLNKILKERL
jgi:hypothetical protein